jgi:hypothetical protein
MGSQLCYPEKRSDTASPTAGDAKSVPAASDESTLTSGPAFNKAWDDYKGSIETVYAKKMVGRPYSYERPTIFMHLVHLHTLYNDGKVDDLKNEIKWLRQALDVIQPVYSAGRARFVGAMDSNADVKRWFTTGDVCLVPFTIMRCDLLVLIQCLLGVN